MDDMTLKLCKLVCLSDLIIFDIIAERSQLKSRRWRRRRRERKRKKRRNRKRTGRGSEGRR